MASIMTLFAGVWYTPGRDVKNGEERRFRGLRGKPLK
jgi:hypothetical protein